MKVVVFVGTGVGVAVGGTGVTTTANKGAAKEWASGSGLIDTASYSAKEYAQSTTAGTDTYGGSAKGWATTAHGVAVPGAASTARSALHYSTEALNSATAAKNSAAAVGQVYDNFSDVYLGSMADSGSSKKRISGSNANALASATLCRSPPEHVVTGLS